MRASARAAGRKGLPPESDATGGPKESTGVQVFALLTLAASAMGCLLALLPAAGHDQMWLLYAADRLRHGARLYGPELFESNPPLIVWMSLVPSMVADWLHLPSTAVGKLLVCGLGGLIGVASRRLLRPWLRLSITARWALGFVYVLAFCVIPARDFGQRDHLLAFLCLPYLITAARAISGSPIPAWQAWVAGLTAGWGIALKPHQIVVVLAVEAVVLLRMRWPRSLLRPESGGVIVAWIAYGFAIVAVCPEYLTRMLPLLRETYWAFGHLMWWQLIVEGWQLHVLACMVVIGTVAAGVRRVSSLVLVLLASGAGAILGYYLQGTGWYYQQLPALTFLAFAGVLLWIERVEHRPLAFPRGAPAAGGGIGVLAVGLTAHFMGYPFTAERSFPVRTPDPVFFVGVAPGTSVATLTTTVDYTIPPVFRYHLVLAQRYPHLWLLPAILRSESGQQNISAETLARLETLQHDAMLEDFLRWKPQLVLVERCQDPVVQCQVLENRHDDLLGWFLRDDRFRRLFSNYRYLRSAGRFDGYVLR